MIRLLARTIEMVILHPRDWTFKFYSRGVIVGFTGRFNIDGTVIMRKFRIGLPIR